MQKRGFALCLPAVLLMTLAAHAEATGAARYPSPDRAWTRHDYVQFYFTHFNGNQALPHLREAAMQAVFDRLVSPDNLSRLRDAPLPDREKVAEIRLMLSALGEIRAAYNVSVVVGEPLSEELTRVQIFTLEALDDAMRLSAAGREMPSDAWSTTVTGVVASLAETAVYSAAQRRELADALADHLDALHPLLSGKAKQLAMDRIGRLAVGESDTSLRNALKRLLVAISES